MRDSNSQKAGTHIVPVVAALLSVSMSILFSKPSVLDIFSVSIFGLECSLTLLAIVATYFLVFYSISKILHSRPVSKHQLVVIYMFSILIILIGLNDIGGIFIKALLWWLITILFIILWKVGIGRIQYWYCVILLPPLALSTILSLTHPSGLLIENTWLENVEYDGNGFVHATFYLQLKAENRKVSDIKIKIVCSDQITIDKDECGLLDIGTLEEDKEKIVKWNVTFEGINTHTFFLYLFINEMVSCKKITIRPEGGQWKVEIENI